MPTDDELHEMTGMSDLSIAANMDWHLLSNWIEAGFTREEAFQLLIALKASMITVSMTKED